jgi:hypothetical protein
MKIMTEWRTDKNKKDNYDPNAILSIEPNHTFVGNAITLDGSESYDITHNTRKIDDPNSPDRSGESSPVVDMGPYEYDPG